MIRVVAADPRFIVVLVNGAGVGLGKSTLAKALHRELEEAGYQAAHFEENDILTDPSFASVIRDFQTRTRVELATLLDAARAYLDVARAGGATVYVLDALFPYLPSLLAWGYSDEEIIGFFHSLADLFQGGPVIELYLHGDLRRGVERATAREGEKWLAQLLTRASRHTPTPVESVDDLVAASQAAAARARILVNSAPWTVALLNADEGADAVLTAARHRLRNHLGLAI